MAAVDCQQQWDDTADCAKGTLEWFPENTTYQSWKGSSASMVLLITAEAGCGKTVLAKHLSLHLGPIEQPRVPCCYFFFHSRNESSTVANTLFTLLCYLLRSPLVHPEYSKFVLGQHHSPVSLIKRGDRFLYDLICKAAPHIHCGASPFPCILDALDECKDPERLIKLLHDNNTEFPFKLAITTREIIDKPRWKSSSIINLNDYQDSITDDIRTVIKKNVEQLDIETGEDKKASLERDTVAQAGETFLWQESFFAEIRLMSTSSISKIRDLLKDTPSSVRECYERILERRPHPKTTRRILNILVASARPLTLDEFDVSLGVTTDEPSWEVAWKDVSHRLEGPSNIETFLKHHCGSLLKIRNGTVVVFHQTVKDFLLSSKIEITLEGANERLAIGCINYLLLKDWNACRIKFKRRCFAFSEGREGVPKFLDLPLLTTDPSYSMTCFYEYSARHWFQHAEEATQAQDPWKAFMDSNETTQCDSLIQGVKTLCTRSRGRLATSIPAFPDTDTPLLFSLRIRCLPLIFGILCQLENPHTLLKEQFGSQPLLLALEQNIPAAFLFMLNHFDKEEHYTLLSDALRHAIKFQNSSMTELILNVSQKSNFETNKHRALHVHALACAIDRDMLQMVKFIMDLAQKSGFSDLLNHDLTQRSLDPAVRGQSSVFDFLIDHGFTFGDSSLKRAISKDCICSDRCVGALLQSGVIPKIEHLHQAVSFGRTAVLDSLLSHYISGHSISDQNLALFLSDETSKNDRRCWPVLQVLLEDAMFLHFSNSGDHPLKTSLFETLPQIFQSRPTLRNVLIMLALGIRDEDGKMLQATHDYRLGDETIHQIQRASAASGNIPEITWRKIIGAALLNVNEVRALHRAGASPSSSDTRSIALSNFFDDRWVTATDRYISTVHGLSMAVSDLSVDCIKSTAFLFDMPETTAAPTLLLLTNRYSIESVIEFLRARGRAIHFFGKTMTVQEAVDATSLDFVVRSFQGFLAQLSAVTFESIARHLRRKAPRLAFAHDKYNATNIEHVLVCACKHNRPLALQIISYAENENNQNVPRQVAAEALHCSVQAGDLDLCKALLQSGGDEVANSIYSGRTPLMEALLNHQFANWPLDRSRSFSREQNDDIIKLFLSYGADPWLDIGKTPVSWLDIKTFGDPDLHLVEEADPRLYIKRNKNFFNPTSSALSIAAESYGLKSFIELWEQVPSALPVNAKGQEPNSGKSMLHRAVYDYQDLQFVKHLLENMQIDPKKRDRQKRSVLHDLVAGLGRRAISKSLLEKSVKPLIKLLIARGADINGFDNFGFAPIHILTVLCKNKSVADILEILISSGAYRSRWLVNESEPSIGRLRIASRLRGLSISSSDICFIQNFLKERRRSDLGSLDRERTECERTSLNRRGPRERSADEWQQEIIRNFNNSSSGLNRDKDILSHPCEEEFESSHDEDELPDWESEYTSGGNESIPDTEMNIQEKSQTDTAIQNHVHGDQDVGGSGRREREADNITFYGDFY